MPIFDTAKTSTSPTSSISIKMKLVITARIALMFITIGLLALMWTWNVRGSEIERGEHAAILFVSGLGMGVVTLLLLIPVPPEYVVPDLKKAPLSVFVKDCLLRPFRGSIKRSTFYLAALGSLSILTIGCSAILLITPSS